ncbi:unnamed protein product [Paramecium sonneborni]|uniref:Transmembrane protein n=1 Tax=Paramecium sonneborni TaxID=65129 RepID=A0A8S1M7E3_9CILI|nr:unnamed protein product [Paramecium sonneborni]
MNKIILQTKTFYTKDFLHIKETWRKSYLIAVVLLIIENIQMVSIYTNDIIQFEYDQFLIHFRSIIEFSRFYTILGNSTLIRSIFSIFGFFLSSIFLTLILYSLLNINIFIQKKQQLKFLTIEQLDESNTSDKHLLNWMLSFFFQINLSILQIPYLFCGITLLVNIIESQSLNSLEYVGVIFSILLMTQQILIGLFIHLHQFEYRMKTYDFLGKFQTLKIHVLFGFQLLYIFYINRTLEQYYYLLLKLIHWQYNYLEYLINYQRLYIVSINKFMQIIEYLDQVFQFQQFA